MAGTGGTGSYWDWLLPVLGVAAGAVASNSEAKQNNKPKTTVQTSTNTPFMANELTPQFQAIAQLLANNYMRNMAKRYPGGQGLSIDPSVISAMFGGQGSVPNGIFGGGGAGSYSALPKVVRGI